MMRHKAIWAGVALAAVSLAACNPPHPKPKPPLKAITALDCPDSQGDLKRRSASGDGKTCVYGTDAGDQVTLQLVGLDGKDVRTALAPIEAQLKQEVPAAAGGTTPGAGAPDKDKVDIDLPGIHIHTSGDGHAKVDTAGVHVDADDKTSGGAAKVSVDGGPSGHGVVVNADEGGAQIRVDQGGGGVRATYILASETAGPHGYKVAGYEARGPAGGPIAVASILAKADDEDDLRHDVRALLERNVGG